MDLLEVVHILLLSIFCFRNHGVNLPVEGSAGVEQISSDYDDHLLAEACFNTLEGVALESYGNANKGVDTWTIDWHRNHQVCAF